MARVIGIGGVFFRSASPDATRDWYRDNLGLPTDDGYAVLKWRRADEDVTESTVWSPFAADTEYFGPGGSELMVNYIVDDLDGMLAQLRASGVEVLPDVQEMAGIGRFGWAVDCDGRRIELWQPER